MVLKYKGYIIPFDKMEFEQDQKFKILSKQIEHSLYLIKNETAVANERKKLRKVWASFIDLTVKKFGAKALPMNSNQFLLLLKFYSQCDILEKKPWLDCSILQKDDERIFVIIPVGNFKLFGSINDDLTIPVVDTNSIPDSVRRDVSETLIWALTKKVPFPTLTFNHDQVTDVIFKAVYGSPEKYKLNSEISFHYDDGSIGSSFVLPKIKKILFKKSKNHIELKIGLITRRHLEIDAIIDFYLLRDTEISDIGKNNSFAAQQAFSHEKSLEFFEEIKSHDSMILSIYASGLIPANIGLISAIFSFKNKYPKKSLQIEFYRFRFKSGYNDDKLIFS